MGFKELLGSDPEQTAEQTGLQGEKNEIRVGEQTPAGRRGAKLVNNWLAASTAQSSSGAMFPCTAMLTC